MIFTSRPRPAEDPDMESSPRSSHLFGRLVAALCVVAALTGQMSVHPGVSAYTRPEALAQRSGTSLRQAASPELGGFKRYVMSEPASRSSRLQECTCNRSRHPRSEELTIPESLSVAAPESLKAQNIVNLEASPLS